MLMGIKEITEYVQDNMKDPVPQYIIKKEIIKDKILPSDMADLYESIWYKQLLSEQYEDGSWGRFHSMDSSIKGRKFKTTESALLRAKDIGLSKEDAMVSKAVNLLEGYIVGTIPLPDRIEVHKDGGKSFIRSIPFMASSDICMFYPDNDQIQPCREICVTQLQKSFVGDEFDENTWKGLNRELKGICLDASSIYPLRLLQKENCISEELQKQFLSYIWNRKEGIYYISDYAPSVRFSAESKDFTRWLYALETLSGFSLFTQFMKEDVYSALILETNKLINDEVNVPSSNYVVGKYTENQRNSKARKNDLILRILRILIKCDMLNMTKKD